MKLKRLIKKLVYYLKLFFNRELSYFKNKDLVEFRPVFLIGCGRSGTTILGHTLGNHNEICYLNEKRTIWHSAYPDFNIWDDKTQNPKMIVKKSDSNPKKNEKLKRLFHKEQIIDKSRILLEKLPTNSFRLEFINEVFPNAKFIYLYRNGIEVAKSIEIQANKGKWFGKNDFRWKLLNKLINSDNRIPKKEFSNFEKGLLEWRFSMEFSERFFSKITQDKVFKLSYESFVSQPKIKLKEIYSFLDLDIQDADLDNLTKNIKRRSIKVDQMDEDLRKLGGEQLAVFVNSK